MPRILESKPEGCIEGRRGAHPLRGHRASHAREGKEIRPMPLLTTIPRRHPNGPKRKERPDAYRR
jgi:hypothetical protein